MSAGGIFRPGMRAYFVPLVAGLALATSAFLPWVVVADVTIRGVPDVPGLWIVGLGALAAVLALLRPDYPQELTSPAADRRVVRARHHVPVVADSSPLRR
jgi:hypothetical protein